MSKSNSKFKIKHLKLLNASIIKTTQEKNRR